MFFLLSYDRSTAQVVSLQSVDAGDMQAAFDRRVDLEVAAFMDGQNVEIVILEAGSEQLLRRSHARYFEDLRAVLQEP